MCALRAHINFHFWKINFSRIEKVMTIFSTLDKIFLKIKSLMCALRAHVNQTHIYIQASAITLFERFIKLEYCLEPNSVSMSKALKFE